MSIRTNSAVLLAASLLVLSFQLPATAQIAFEDTPFGNVGGVGGLGRAPGEMVRSGVARAFETADFARGGVNITETARPISDRALLLTGTLSLFFDQLNQLLTFFEDLMLARAGLTPVADIVTSPTTPDPTTPDPADTPPPDTGGRR